MRRPLLALSFALNLFAGCGGETGADLEHELELLTYNVAGLPDELSGSNPSVNTPLISAELDGFALVLVQEDFAYHEQLASQATHAFGYGPGEAGMGHAFGDGLAAFSRFSLAPPEREMWRSCSGTVDRRNDCLAAKGFTFTELSLDAHHSVDLYNLHMDAGSDPLDAEARADQVEQLLEHMASRQGRPVILAGDTNLKSESREADATAYARLVSGAGLSDACRALECGEPDRIDRVFFRGGDPLQIAAESWALSTRFFDQEGNPLSDHEPVVVKLRISVVGP